MGFLFNRNAETDSAWEKWQAAAKAFNEQSALDNRDGIYASEEFLRRQRNLNNAFDTWRDACQRNKKS